MLLGLLLDGVLAADSGWAICKAAMKPWREWMGTVDSSLRRGDKRADGMMCVLRSWASCWPTP